MGAVFYDRRGVTGIDSAAHPLALRACHVSVRTSTKHAYAGAEDGEQKVLPTGMCGSDTKLPVSRLTSAPIGVANCQRTCQKEILRNLGF